MKTNWLQLVLSETGKGTGMWQAFGTWLKYCSFTPGNALTAFFKHAHIARRSVTVTALCANCHNPEQHAAGTLATLPVTKPRHGAALAATMPQVTAVVAGARRRVVEMRRRKR